MRLLRIRANTPQAKGRVERANAYMPTYMAAHNARFARQSANNKDLHRPLEPRHNIATSMECENYPQGLIELRPPL
jgi:hypothetical protein